MSSFKHFNTITLGYWRLIQSIVTMSTLIVITASLVILTGCGGGDSDPAPTPTPTIAAPGVPISFDVVRTPETTLSATLSWSAPLSGGDPGSFEIYRSTTAGTVFQPTNHLISIPIEAGKTNYSFIDAVGLTPRVETFWVVTAKNAGGETPTHEVAYIPIGGGGDTGFGNNLSAALIFADDIGLSGLPITGSWTFDVASLDFNTGLRPLSTEITPEFPVTLLPYFDPQTAYVLDNVTYYRQQSASTWQGQWENGAGTPQHVNAAWGDNLISQSLSVNSVIRIEMVLTKSLTTPITSYTMKSLYGSHENEVQGTDGITYDNSTAFVFAANAHLKIQKMVAGVPDGAPSYDQTLWLGDGPGYLGGEVNVAGNFTYGFVWNVKNEVAPPSGKAGTWRITFSLDATSPKATSNNTFIDTVTNGVRVSDSEVYIDIDIQ